MSNPVRATRRSNRNSLNPVTDNTGPNGPRKSISRATPRNSEVEATPPEDTPYANLRQLAGLIKRPTTPQGRATAGTSLSTRASARRTPNTQDRTPGRLGQRPGSEKRGAVTPHGLRALQQRRAAAGTPGRDRRRSGRVQRETPRDLLRGLSKLLAKDSQPFEPTPPTGASTRSRAKLQTADELDDEPDPPRPRLSMAIDDDDDSFHEPAPRLSVPLDEGATEYSVELPRRAYSAQPGSRLSRGSFGSIRMSDRFEDINELGLDATLDRIDEDSAFAEAMEEYDEDEEPVDDDVAVETGEETRALQRAFFEEAMRPSDVTDVQSGPMEVEDDTFYIPVPEQEVLEDQPEVSLQEDMPRRPSTSPRDPTIRTEVDDVRPGEQMDEDSDELAAEQEDTDEDEATATARLADITASTIREKKPSVKKKLKKSRHGIAYPSLPTNAIRKMAANFARTSGNTKTKLSKETIASIEQASEWFFEQLSEDLGAYAEHAGRKTIDESDVVMLMKRQRQLNANTTTFSLAQRYLPRELLQDIRMIPPNAKMKAPKRKRRLQTVAEEDEE